MVDIILKKRITVKTIIVRADISFLKPINYFLPILQHMKENSWRTNSKIFCEKLLGLGNNAIAESLLSRCVYLELIEKSYNSHSDITDYKITENGKSALDEKSVFIPEEGVWEIHYTEDQFIPSKSQILTIIQPPPKILQETNRSKKENKKHTAIPVYFKKLIKKRLTMIKDNDVIINEFKPHVEKIGKSTNGNISWNVKNNFATFSFNIENKKFDTKILIPNVTGDQILNSLLKIEKMDRKWDKTRNSLLLDFDETTDADRVRMSKKLLFKHPNIMQFGEFDDLEIDVNILPNTESSAKKWAYSLFLNSITKYATRKNYEKWINSVTSKFSEYNISIIKRTDIAAGLENSSNSAIYWRIHAMEDWDI